MRVNKLAIFLITLITSCSPYKYLSDGNKLVEFEQLTLDETVQFDLSNNSEDITPNHLIGIGKGIYPNEKDFPLETPRTYKLKEGEFLRQTRYFYTENDRSVKVILYQWDPLSSKTYEPEEIVLKKISRYDDKWNSLVNELDRKLGEPISQKVESVSYPKYQDRKEVSVEELMEDTKGPDSSWRDECHWQTEELNAYLFLIGDNQTGYREISLALWSE